MPTSGHLIFIPAVLLIGIIIGFIFGSRAAADRFNLERKRDEERARARAERAARKAAAGGGDDDADGGGEAA